MSRNKFIRIISMLGNRFMPIYKNTVFFDSFAGQYNDNPKYISEALHQLDPSVNIVWTTSEHGHEIAPEYAQKVTYQSAKYFSYLNRAAVVIDNYTGLRNFGFQNFKSELLHKLIDKKKQLCISTWHGTPLKKIGKDIKHTAVKDYYSCTDYCIAGCKYTADIMEQAYFFADKLRLYGTPRNDILFRDDVDTAALKKKLCLPENKRIVLFAPTFRDSIDMSGVKQMKMINIKVLLNKLSNRFNGDEFALVMRVHHGVLEKINTEQLTEVYKGMVFNGNIGDDMAEYLKCTDVLITDYSGSLFDFALTKKPCFLFAPDRNHYEKIERGFYIDYDSVPFPIAESFPELLNYIESFSKYEYKNKVASFLNIIGNVEDGHAAERVAANIKYFLTTGKKSTEQNTHVFSDELNEV